MLTPPSRHFQVMQQNVAESKAIAEALREQHFTEKLAADRASAVGHRRQRICAAYKERDAFLLRARALFDMSMKQVLDSEPVRVPSQKLPGPLQRVPLKTKAPAKGQNAQGKHSGTGEKVHVQWSEVSTAAPSTVGADDEISFKPEDETAGPGVKNPAASSNHRKSAGSGSGECEVGNDSLKELEMALTRVQKRSKRDGQRKCWKSEVKLKEQEECDVLDETLSSSDESFLDIVSNKPCAPASTAKQNESGAVRASCQRGSSRSADRSVATNTSNVQRAAQLPKRKGRPASSCALKSVSKEEEALQQSLLRMDFEEMKRQFSGQKPLWRDKEVMGESFKTDPDRESKLEASLQRLDEKFYHLQAQQEVRLKQDEERAGGQARAPGRLAKGNARTRPRSSVGRTYSAQRRWRVEVEVPTIHAEPLDVEKQGQRN